MQNKYNLFYNPNPNIPMMTYFYPRKHGMAAGPSAAKATPTHIPRTGPPLMRYESANLKTDPHRGQ